MRCATALRAASPRAVMVLTPSHHRGPCAVTGPLSQCRGSSCYHLACHRGSACRGHCCSPSRHCSHAPTVAAAHAIVVLTVLQQGRRRCGPVIIVLWPHCAATSLTTTAARCLCRLLRLRGPHAAATSRCYGRAPPLQQLAPRPLESPSQQLALLEGEGVSTGEGEGEGESDRACEGER
jgi:hypothetical protein